MLRTAFILLLVAFFFLFSLKSYIAALYTYWWFAIFRPQDWVWIDLSSLRLPLIAAFLLITSTLIKRKIPKINNPISLLILLLCLTAATANSLNGCSEFSVAITVFDLFVLAYVVLLSGELLDDRKTIFWLAVVISLSIGFHAGKGGWYAILTGANFYGAKTLKGFLTGSNAYALGTATMLFFMIFSFQFIEQFMSSKSRIMSFMQPLLKWGLLLIIMGSMYNVIATQSRGSNLSMLIGLLVWVLLHEKRKKMLTILSIVLIIGVSIVPIPTGFVERIESVFAESEERDHSAAGRPHFWGTALEIAQDHPLGVGPGCFPVYYNLYDSSGGQFGYYRSVHGSHAQILNDTGFVGMFIWILLFIFSFKKLFSIRRRAFSMTGKDADYFFYFYLANALICSQLVFILGGTFYEFAYNDITWLIWGIIIGISRLFENELGKTRQNNYQEASKP